MAPTSGRKRVSARAKAAHILTSRPLLPLSTPITRSNPASNADKSLFSASKRDKRTIKHSSFIGKIEKSSSKTPKRRRPNKKLVANLETLANALPDLEDSVDGKGQAEVVVGQAKIQRKSLKTRPGAMKRKENLEKMERDRFNKNLAQLAGHGGAGAATSATSIADRWAALKSHVQSTVEKKAEFVKT